MHRGALMPVEGVAWIVAIEQYAGPELKIESVGLWALELAELMVSLEVPKIVLSTSLRNQPAYASRLTVLEEKGVIRTNADRGDIENALQKVQGTGTLLIYWAGHGIMAPARQLLCADSRTSDLRTIEIDGLLKRLRAREYPRLQIGFLECCAQVVTTTPASLDLGGDGNASTRQFFYHAASAGETATATTKKPGFSSTVLQALRGLQTLPPDPVLFFGQLKTALGNLPLQTRPFLERTEESGDIWSSGDPNRPNESFDAASVAELTQSQFEHLWRTVRNTRVKPVELARAYRDGKLGVLKTDLAAAEPFSTAPDLLGRAAAQLELQKRFEPLCRRLHLLLRDWLGVYDRFAADGLTDKPEVAEDIPRLMLCALDKPAPDSWRRAFLRFLLLAARHTEKKNADADTLRAALRNDPETGPYFDSVLSELPLEDDRLYLLLDVDWEPNTKTASLVNAWIYPGLLAHFDARPVASEGKLAQQIEAVVQKVLYEFPRRQLLVELLAPNELLSTPRELLEVVDAEIDTRTWLEAEQAITLRWRDRMKGKFKRGTWAQKWEEVWGSACNAASLSCAWQPGRDPGEDDHLVGLSIPGPCPEEPKRNSADFFGELIKGAPYMCWPRNEVSQADEFRKAADKFFAGSKLKTLSLDLPPKRTDPMLRDLVLLIDEPKRNPYEDPEHLTETAQRGAN
jgi:hypothetical protein